MANVRAKDLAAFLADRLLPGDSQDPLCSAVEARNAEILINGEDAVRHAVQDGPDKGIPRTRFDEVPALLFRGGWLLFPGHF
jgi:hypothetical protein